MTIEIAAWLILRIVYAWMFLYPLKNLLRDWSGCLALTRLIVPFAVPLFTLLMLCVMFFGGIAILLGIGIYGRLAGLALCIYCLMGAYVHYCLARKAKASHLSETASAEDKKVLSEVSNLGAVGQITSAEKNFVLAAVGMFFFLMGTGPQL